MELKTYFAQDRSGNLIPSATVSIFLTGTQTLATGLKTVSGASLMNPFTADADGKIQFYAPDGIYDMQVSLGSVSGVKVTFQCLDVQQQLSAANSAAERAEAAAESVENQSASIENNSREQWRRQLADVGLTLVNGSFEEGATATKTTDAVWHILGGQCYTWGGELPKTVAPASTPDSTGGVGANAWSSVREDSLRLKLKSDSGAESIGTAQDGVTVQKLASGYNFVGVADEDNVVTSNTDAIKDTTTGFFWVYEGNLSTPLSVDAGTVPPAEPMARYKTTNWRCVGLLNGYAETDVKNYGAKGNGVTDDWYSIQLALYHSKSAVYLVGHYRLASNTLIKPVGVSLLGVGGYVGAQLGANLPVSTITFDGPVGKDIFAIDNGESPAVEDSGRVNFVYLRAINASKDNLSGIKLTKSGNACDNGLINFWTGIKFDGGAAYVQIHRNNINSCNCCLDLAGSESHVTNNHGYHDSLRTSTQFRPAILIRSSGNIVTQNKFFGDGANTPRGIEVWGFGNVIANNVLDAFTDVAVIIRCNDSSVVPDNNVVSDNVISGIGDSSDPANTFRAGIVIDNTGPGAGNIRNTLITGNSMFNKRPDRQMQHGVVINALSGSLPDSRTIYDTLITANTFGSGITGRKVIAIGANHSRSRSTNNAGIITESIGSGAYTNGQVVNHGMDRTPEFIELTLIDSGVPVALSYTNVTETSFTISIRDGSAGISGNRQVAWKAYRISP